MPPAVLNRAFFRDFFPPIEEVGQHLIEHPTTGLLMVLVPAGEFLTDTDGGAPFKVDLPAYYVAVHPVTNAQYARFVAETGFRKPESSLLTERSSVWINGSFPPAKADHPVVCVGWEDATAYCRWAGLRLPMELEWEKAARGLDGRTFPWGQGRDLSRCRNTQNKGAERTAGVWRYGQGGAPFGGLQLSGNVREWCADWYDSDAYTRYRRRNLAPPSSGQYRVARGGSWDDGHPDRFSASIRRFDTPLSRNDNYGFRCVRGLGAPP